MWMCSCLIHRDIALTALLGFRWAGPLVQWSLQSDSLSHLSATSSQIPRSWPAFKPPPSHITSQKASRRPSSAKHHLYGNITFSSCCRFPAPKWKTSKNEVPTLPTIMDWNLIFSVWCEQKILEICFYRRPKLDKPLYASSIRLPRFTDCACVCVCERSLSSGLESRLLPGCSTVLMMGVQVAVVDPIYGAHSFYLSCHNAVRRKLVINNIPED